jgi:ribosomal protein S18 acetylase RimI-like enzyme
MLAIRAMETSDYAAVAALWRRTDGVAQNESDSEEAIAAFLRRNLGMSSVAVAPGGAVVGAVLCGSDGRRGYLHHLAVEREARRSGVAGRLIARCFAELDRAGIAKCNLFLFDDNASGAAFWEHNGWLERSDLRVFQKGVRPGVVAALGS